MEYINKEAFRPVMRDLPRAGAEIGVAAAAEILRREGVLVLENLLEPDVLETIEDELEPWFDAAHHGRGPFFGRSTRRFSGLFAKAPSTADLALHPLVLGVMEQVLKGSDMAPCADTIELSITQAIGIEPGEPAQFLHRDDMMFAFPHDFELMANAIWALDDFTEENGATRLIPGSHKTREVPPQPGQTIQATAPKGSAVLWLGGTLHGGGANNTDRIRRGVVMSYKLGWLAPAEKLLLSIPPTVARTLPERLQRLIGYQLHRPNLGWVEGRDPVEWLRGEIGELAPMDDNFTPMSEMIFNHVMQSPEQYLGYLT